MGSSQRRRVLVFAVFLAALILFALLYRPADAASRPVDNHAVASVPAVPAGEQVAAK